MMLQAHEEALSLVEIFKYICLKFLDVLDCLWSHLGVVENTETTAPSVSTNQDHSKRSILSRLVEMVASVFGSDSSGG